MKKLAVIAVAIAGIITAIATVASAGSAPRTGITGSMHDINSMDAPYAGDSLGRSCVFCHTPHSAVTGSIAPLWNRADIDAVTDGLPAYSWVSPANAATSVAVPGGLAFGDPLIGPSRLCMSCHDGLTAVDAHNSQAGTVEDPIGTTLMQSARATISDLEVTHPIGFKYDDAYLLRGATELVPSSTGFIDYDVTSAFDTNNRTGAPLSAKKISDTLYGGFMTCASCHDVHNTVNAEPSAGNTYNYFLYAKQEGSAICLSCHVK